MNRCISFAQVLLLSAAFLLSCQSAKQIGEKGEAAGLSLPADLKLNEIQVLGTHNSYAKPVDTAVLNYIDPILARAMGPQFLASMPAEARAQYQENHPQMLPMSEMLAYNHPNFDEQLNAGLRSLEIDVYHDPEGGRFSHPASYAVLGKMGKQNLAPYDTAGLSAPGFKVLHVSDLDFRTHYPTFKGALQALRTWSDAHPNHIPVFILIEAKDKGLPLFPGSAQVLPFDEAAYAALDNDIFSILGKDKLITPHQVRGTYPTLEAAVLDHNWPKLSASLGKFVFLLLPSAGGFSTETPYLNGRPSLEGRAMFVQSLPGQAHAAFLLLDNALMRQNEIQEAVAKGYLVRTRADIDCYEAKVNDPSRAQAAFESGAQVVSTDFFRPGNGFGTPYVVSLPGGKAARVSPAAGKR